MSGVEIDTCAITQNSLSCLLNLYYHLHSLPFSLRLSLILPQITKPIPGSFSKPCQSRNLYCFSVATFMPTGRQRCLPLSMYARATVACSFNETRIQELRCVIKLTTPGISTRYLLGILEDEEDRSGGSMRCRNSPEWQWIDRGQPMFEKMAVINAAFCHLGMCSAFATSFIPHLTVSLGHFIASWWLFIAGVGTLSTLETYLGWCWTLLD